MGRTAKNKKHFKDETVKKKDNVLKKGKVVPARKDIECEACGGIFTSESACLTHLAKDHGKKIKCGTQWQFICMVCDTNCSTAYIRSHQKSHMHVAIQHVYTGEKMHCTSSRPKQAEAPVGRGVAENSGKKDIVSEPCMQLTKGNKVKKVGVKACSGEKACGNMTAKKRVPSKNRSVQFEQKAECSETCESRGATIRKKTSKRIAKPDQNANSCKNTASFVSDAGISIQKKKRKVRQKQVDVLDLMVCQETVPNTTPHASLGHNAGGEGEIELLMVTELPKLPVVKEKPIASTSSESWPVAVNMMKCQWCLSSFAKPTQLKAHVREAHPEHHSYRKGSIKAEKKLFICPQCKAVFLRAQHLKSHSQTHTEPFRNVRTDCSISAKKVQMPFKCAGCANVFPDSASYSEHLDECASQITCSTACFHCGVCKVSFDTIGRLQAHICVGPSMDSDSQGGAESSPDVCGRTAACSLPVVGSSPGTVSEDLSPVKSSNEIIVVSPESDSPTSKVDSILVNTQEARPQNVDKENIDHGDSSENALSMPAIQDRHSLPPISRPDLLPSSQVSGITEETPVSSGDPRIDSPSVEEIDETASVSMSRTPPKDIEVLDILCESRVVGNQLACQNILNKQAKDHMMRPGIAQTSSSSCYSDGMSQTVVESPKNVINMSEHGCAVSTMRTQAKMVPDCTLADNNFNQKSHKINNACVGSDVHQRTNCPSVRMPDCQDLLSQFNNSSSPLVSDVRPSCSYTHSSHSTGSVPASVSMTARPTSTRLPFQTRAGVFQTLAFEASNTELRPSTLPVERNVTAWKSGACDSLSAVQRPRCHCPRRQPGPVHNLTLSHTSPTCNQSSPLQCQSGPLMNHRYVGGSASQTCDQTPPSHLCSFPIPGTSQQQNFMDNVVNRFSAQSSDATLSMSNNNSRKFPLHTNHSLQRLQHASSSCGNYAQDSVSSGIQSASNRLETSMESVQFPQRCSGSPGLHDRVHDFESGAPQRPMTLATPVSSQGLLTQDDIKQEQDTSPVKSESDGTVNDILPSDDMIKEEFDEKPSHQCKCEDCGGFYEAQIPQSSGPQPGLSQPMVLGTLVELPQVKDETDTEVGSSSSVNPTSCTGHSSSTVSLTPAVQNLLPPLPAHVSPVLAQREEILRRCREVLNKHRGLKEKGSGESSRDGVSSTTRSMSCEKPALMTTTGSTSDTLPRPLPPRQLHLGVVQEPLAVERCNAHTSQRTVQHVDVQGRDNAEHQLPCTSQKDILYDAAGQCRKHSVKSSSSTVAAHNPGPTETEKSNSQSCGEKSKSQGKKDVCQFESISEASSSEEESIPNSSLQETLMKLTQIAAAVATKSGQGQAEETHAKFSDDEEPQKSDHQRDPSDHLRNGPVEGTESGFPTNMSQSVLLANAGLTTTAYIPQDLSSEDTPSSEKDSDSGSPSRNRSSDTMESDSSFGLLSWKSVTNIQPGKAARRLFSEDDSSDEEKEQEKDTHLPVKLPDDKKSDSAGGSNTSLSVPGLQADVGVSQPSATSNINISGSQAGTKAGSGTTSRGDQRIVTSHSSSSQKGSRPHDAASLHGRACHNSTSANNVVRRVSPEPICISSVDEDDVVFLGETIHNPASSIMMHHFPAVVSPGTFGTIRYSRIFHKDIPILRRRRKLGMQTGGIESSIQPTNPVLPTPISPVSQNNSRNKQNHLPTQPASFDYLNNIWKPNSSDPSCIAKAIYNVSASGSETPEYVRGDISPSLSITSSQASMFSYSKPDIPLIPVSVGPRCNNSSPMSGSTVSSSKFEKGINHETKWLDLTFTKPVAPETSNGESQYDKADFTAVAVDSPEIEKASTCQNADDDTEIKVELIDLTDVMDSQENSAVRQTTSVSTNTEVLCPSEPVATQTAVDEDDIRRDACTQTGLEKEISAKKPKKRSRVIPVNSRLLRSRLESRRSKLKARTIFKAFKRAQIKARRKTTHQSKVKKGPVFQGRMLRGRFVAGPISMKKGSQKPKTVKPCNVKKTQQKCSTKMMPEMDVKNCKKRKTDRSLISSSPMKCLPGRHCKELTDDLHSAAVNEQRKSIIKASNCNLQKKKHANGEKICLEAEKKHTTRSTEILNRTIDKRCEVKGGSTFPEQLITKKRRKAASQASSHDGQKDQNNSVKHQAGTRKKLSSGGTEEIPVNCKEMAKNPTSRTKKKNGIPIDSSSVDVHAATYKTGISNEDHNKSKKSSRDSRQCHEKDAKVGINQDSMVPGQKSGKNSKKQKMERNIPTVMPQAVLCKQNTMTPKKINRRSDHKDIEMLENNQSVKPVVHTKCSPNWSNVTGKEIEQGELVCGKDCQNRGVSGNCTTSLSNNREDMLIKTIEESSIQANTEQFSSKVDSNKEESTSHLKGKTSSDTLNITKVKRNSENCVKDTNSEETLKPEESRMSSSRKGANLGVKQVKMCLRSRPLKQDYKQKNQKKHIRKIHQKDPNSNCHIAEVSSVSRRKSTEKDLASKSGSECNNIEAVAKKNTKAGAGEIHQKDPNSNYDIVEVSSVSRRKSTEKDLASKSSKRKLEIIEDTLPQSKDKKMKFLPNEDQLDPQPKLAHTRKNKRKSSISRILIDISGYVTSLDSTDNSCDQAGIHCKNNPLSTKCLLPNEDFGRKQKISGGSECNNIEAVAKEITKAGAGEIHQKDPNSNCDIAEVSSVSRRKSTEMDLARHVFEKTPESHVSVQESHIIIQADVHRSSEIDSSDEDCDDNIDTSNSDVAGEDSTETGNVSINTQVTQACGNLDAKSTIPSKPQPISKDVLSIVNTADDSGENHKQVGSLGDREKLTGQNKDYVHSLISDSEKSHNGEGISGGVDRASGESSAREADEAVKGLLCSESLDATESANPQIHGGGAWLEQRINGQEQTENKKSLPVTEVVTSIDSSVKDDALGQPTQLCIIAGHEQVGEEGVQIYYEDAEMSSALTTEFALAPLGSGHILQHGQSFLLLPGDGQLIPLAFDYSDTADNVCVNQSKQKKKTTGLGKPSDQNGTPKRVTQPRYDCESPRKRKAPRTIRAILEDMAAEKAAASDVNCAKKTCNNLEKDSGLPVTSDNIKHTQDVPKVPESVPASRYPTLAKMIQSPSKSIIEEGGVLNFEGVLFNPWKAIGSEQPLPLTSLATQCSNTESDSGEGSADIAMDTNSEGSTVMADNESKSWEAGDADSVCDEPPMLLPESNAWNEHCESAKGSSQRNLRTEFAVEQGNVKHVAIAAQADEGPFSEDSSEPPCLDLMVSARDGVEAITCGKKSLKVPELPSPSGRLRSWEEFDNEFGKEQRSANGQNNNMVSPGPSGNVFYATVPGLRSQYTPSEEFLDNSEMPILTPECDPHMQSAIVETSHCGSLDEEDLEFASELDDSGETNAVTESVQRAQTPSFTRDEEELGVLSESAFQMMDSCSGVGPLRALNTPAEDVPSPMVPGNCTGTDQTKLDGVLQLDQTGEASDYIEDKNGNEACISKEQDGSPTGKGAVAPTFLPKLQSTPEEVKADTKTPGSELIHCPSEAIGVDSSDGKMSLCEAKDFKNTPDDHCSVMHDSCTAMCSELHATSDDSRTMQTAVTSQDSDPSATNQIAVCDVIANHPTQNIIGIPTSSADCLSIPCMDEVQYSIDIPCVTTNSPEKILCDGPAGQSEESLHMNSLIAPMQSCAVDTSLPDVPVQHLESDILVMDCGVLKENEEQKHTSTDFQPSSVHDPFRCGVCEQVFGDIASYNAHLKTHNFVKSGKRSQYQCEECSRVFSSPSQVEHHMICHSKQPGYKCSDCGTLLASISSLKEHKKVHMKQHRCYICEKTFGKPYQLKLHMTTHLGKKSYECPMCRASFARPSRLESHMNIHFREKPHKCPCCPAAFARITRFEKHMKVHEMLEGKVQLHKCDVCGVEYSQLGGLEKHKKTHEQAHDS